LPPQSLSVPALVSEGVRLRPTRSPDAVTAATKASLSSLAHRISALGDELTALDERIEALLEAVVPELLGLFVVGPDIAAALVKAAGDNPERLRMLFEGAVLQEPHPRGPIVPGPRAESASRVSRNPAL
jgi:transposase